MKNDKANKMFEEYQKGFSLAEVGRMFGVTRQSVYTMFKTKGRNFKIRDKKILPFQTFNGKKYSLRNHGYYSLTNRKRALMHRDVWEFYNNKIPLGWDIHHKDFDKSNNKIENLEIYKKDEHSRKFATGHNQYTKNRNKSQ